jgi:hypothetical protein
MSGFEPKVDVHHVQSKAGRTYVNVRIKCGSRAILFDPSHVDNLLRDLVDAQFIADQQKADMIEEKKDGYHPEDYEEDP